MVPGRHKKGVRAVVICKHLRLSHEIYVLKGICWYDLSLYDHVAKSIMLELLAVLELQRDNIVHQKMVKKHNDCR